MLSPIQLRADYSESEVICPVKCYTCYSKKINNKEQILWGPLRICLNFSGLVT